MASSRSGRIKLAVETKYSEFATKGYSGGCCGIGAPSLPRGATDMALSCGSPLEHAPIEPGTTVLDLGCGGGVDVFAASKKVGPKGRVIGVDSTAKMIARARRTAEESGYSNVEFRQGEMEKLPVRANSSNVVISNCAVNLVPSKRRAFLEMHRVLKKGGILVISDIVAERDLPDETRNDLNKWSRCRGGALTLRGLKRVLSGAGFTGFEILERKEWAKGRAEGLPLLSVTFKAVKP